jgi:rod shape determining protein RodA
MVNQRPRALRRTRIIQPVAVTINKPTAWQRIVPMLRGFDYPLLLVILVLATLGLLAMYSSGFDQSGRFEQHARNMALAAVVMLIVAQIPPQRLMELAVPLYVAGIALLVAVALFGVSRKGAQRWIDVGIVVQPSELLKIAMPLMLAWWFQIREGQTRFAEFLVAFLLLAIPVALITREPDLGTAILVLAAGLAVIFFAGLPWKVVLPPLVIGAIAVLLVTMYEPRLCADGVNWHVLREYQRQRICTLLDPTRDPLGRGFHILQAMIAIGSGGLYGKGFMQGTQTHLEFVPERTTDFIFAAFSEEFGLVGNLILIGAFTLLIYRGFKIAAEAPTLFTRLLAAGLTAIIFTYAFVNMGMVSGILPVVGIPLPFVSYGGTALVTLGIALGILLSIAKLKRLMPS